MITKEQYEDYKNLVQDYEQAEYENGMRDAEEDLFNDDLDDEDDEYDERHGCTCGAWSYGPKGFVHVADCICGCG